MSPIIWQKIVAMAAEAGVTEEELYLDRNLCTRFASEIGRRGWRKAAAKRRRKTAAKVSGKRLKQLTLNLF